MLFDQLGSTEYQKYFCCTSFLKIFLELAVSKKKGEDNKTVINFKSPVYGIHCAKIKNERGKQRPYVAYNVDLEATVSNSCSFPAGYGSGWWLW
jgi:hypothetical protein